VNRVVQKGSLPAKKSDPRVDFGRSNMPAFIAIGLAAVVIGVIVGFWNPLLNNAASVEGNIVDRLFGTMLGVATAIFIVVEAGLLYFIIKGRRRGDDDDDEEGLSFHGNTSLEIIWTAIPAALVTLTALGSYAVLTLIEQPQRDALKVEVTGQQFAWSFYYPSLDVTSSELHVPVGQQVALELHSKDVIHQFWIPAYRVKKDVMPDRVTQLTFTANREGTFPIVCTKICGAGHALMRSQVVAQKPADYDAWLADQANGATQLASGDPLAKGRQVFNQNGCNACHKLTDAKAGGTVGPSLDGIGTTAASIIADPSYKGQAKDAEGYIHESIVQPNAYIAPGYQPNIMPQGFGQQISAADLDALVKYLAAQK
jgi:cytochrome c oxidase subunit II